METLQKWNRSKGIIWLSSAVIGFFCLVLNAMTPYIADDYAYMVSFYDQQWVRTLGDVARSMYRHCFIMNGRVIPHALEQIFLLMPKMVFNLANALVITGLLYGMYRIAQGKGERNGALFLGIAMAFWRYLPAFGQVMLWQVGALNYVWALSAMLLFLWPFLSWFMDRESMNWSLWKKILFSAGAVLFGMYTEIASFIGIFTAVMLLLVGWLMDHRKWERHGRWLWIPLGLACVGYVILLKMPAELAAKQGSFAIGKLLENIVNVTKMMETYQLYLLLVWACLMIIGAALQADGRRLLLSLVLLVGGLGANYMLIVASYIPERCLYVSTMLFVLACAVALQALLKMDRPALRIGCLCLGGVLAALFCFSLIPGTYDVYHTYRQFQQREEELKQYKAEGETEVVTLELIYPATKYSAFWGTKFLDTQTYDTWPNNYMAAYYGVRILGK